MRNVPFLCLSLLVLAACTDPAVEDAGPPEPVGLPLLGAGDHTLVSVEVTEIATAADDLSRPRDLAFDPSDPTSLWIVNYTTSVIVLRNAGTPTQTAEYYGGPGAAHFLTKPAAIAFGQTGTFATAPEEDEITQPTTPADFMGPTLWTTDLSVFDGGHSGHLDMLHNSPNSTGIAWERDNVYWVFDGAHSSLTRYDFRLDHGPGGADHTDGIVSRFVEGQVAYSPRVPSHMEFVEGLLYVAEPAGNRVVVLDPSGATQTGPIEPNYDGIDQHGMTGGVLTTLVDGSMVERMSAPSGLVIDGDIIYVGDNETSTIFGIDRNTGEVLDWLDVSAEVRSEGLNGLALDAEGRLYLVDVLGDRIIRIAALP